MGAISVLWYFSIWHTRYDIVFSPPFLWFCRRTRASQSPHFAEQSIVGYTFIRASLRRQKFACVLLTICLRFSATKVARKLHFGMVSWTIHKYSFLSFSPSLRRVGFGPKVKVEVKKFITSRRAKKSPIELPPTPSIDYLVVVSVPLSATSISPPWNKKSVRFHRQIYRQMTFVRTLSFRYFIQFHLKNCMTKKPSTLPAKNATISLQRGKLRNNSIAEKQRQSLTRHTQDCDGQPRELSPAKHRFCPSIPEKSDLIKYKTPIQEL